MPSFHAQLAAACRGPGVTVISDSYSARVYCSPGKVPGERWHVVQPKDTPRLYRWDCVCDCATTGTHV